MAKQLSVKIVTPEKVILKDEYDEAIIPTTAGQIGVLARHTPLVSGLQPGEIKLKKDGNTTSLAVSSGFVEVRPNSKLVILADTAERAEEIDLERAEEARKRAETMLKEKDVAEDVEYASLQAIIEKELARVKVGKKYRKLPPKLN